MSDVRIPYRYLADRRINQLTDGAFRGFVNSFAWSVEQRTDGVILRDDIPLIPRLSVKHVAEFVRVELWIPIDSSSWQIADYKATQTTKDAFEKLDAIRAAAAQKKRDQRAKAAAEKRGVEFSPGDMSRDSPGDIRKGTAQDSDTQGQSDWTVAPIPRSQALPPTEEWSPPITADSGSGEVFDDDELF